ncbi:MAG: hypothetical protein AAGA59_17185 [Actinomycetota bacterium]
MLHWFDRLGLLLTVARLGAAADVSKRLFDAVDNALAGGGEAKPGL